MRVKIAVVEYLVLMEIGISFITGVIMDLVVTAIKNAITCTLKGAMTAAS